MILCLSFSHTTLSLRLHLPWLPFPIVSAHKHLAFLCLWFSHISLLDNTLTLAPSSNSLCTHASPMPLAPPNTIATFPAAAIITCTSLYVNLQPHSHYNGTTNPNTVSSVFIKTYCAANGPWSWYVIYIHFMRETNDLSIKYSSLKVKICFDVVMCYLHVASLLHPCFWAAIIGAMFKHLDRVMSHF